MRLQSQHQLQLAERGDAGRGDYMSAQMTLREFAWRTIFYSSQVSKNHEKCSYKTCENENNVHKCRQPGAQAHVPQENAAP